VGFLAFGWIAAIAFSGRSAAQDLRVVHYGGQFGKAMREAMFDPAEKEMGIKIQDMSRTDMAKIKAMVQSGNIEWDVVNVNTLEVGRGQKEGLWEPIDWKLIDPKVAGPVGPMAYGVPFIGISNGIAYNTDKYKNPADVPKTWADFWNVQKFPGRRALDNRVRYLLEVALLADGVDPAKLYPLDVDRAFRSLERIRPNIAVWANPPVGGTQLIASGDVDLAFAVNNEVENAKLRGAPVGFVFNQGIYTTNSWVIVKGTPHLAKAMEFLRVISQPQYQARLAELTYFGPMNPAALPLVSQKLRDELPTAPANFAGQAVLNNEWWAENEAAMIERFTRWMAR
jgi:putative spermidine/putrescine transport system substrate-binding protein